MSFGDLPTIVERVWNFIVPPLAEVFIIITVTVLLVGYAPLSPKVAVWLSKIAFLSDPEIIRTLEAYGITTLMPIIVAFLILFISYSLHKLAHYLGELIPIRIQTNWQASLARAVPTSLIADVWAYFPNITDLVYLDDMMDERILVASIKENETVFKDAIIYSKRAKKLHNYFDFTKFVLIWGIFVSFLAAFTGCTSWQVLWKLLIFILVMALTGFLIVKRIQYCMEWYSFWKVKGFRSMLHGETKPLPEPDREKQPQLLKRTDRVTELLKQNPVIRIILRTKIPSAQRRDEQSE